MQECVALSISELNLKKISITQKIIRYVFACSFLELSSAKNKQTS